MMRGDDQCSHTASPALGCFLTGLALLVCRRALITVLNMLPPKIAQRAFLAFGGTRDTLVLFENTGSHEALEVMYTYPERRANDEASFSSIFWWNLLENPRAVRNRLELVKHEVASVARTCATAHGTVRLLSVGSGSARPVLEAVASLNGTPPVNMMLLDVNEDALAYSQELAAKLGIADVTYVKGNFLRLERHCAAFSPNVVEMVGLLDYLEDRHAMLLLRQILSVMSPHSYLVTGNISPNRESPFVTKGINWPLVYRSSTKLFRLLTAAGFAEQNINRPRALEDIPRSDRPQAVSTADENHQR